jgi:hypothetical protein
MHRIYGSRNSEEIEDDNGDQKFKIHVADEMVELCDHQISVIENARAA